MNRKNFRIVTFSLLFAGLGAMIASLFVNDQTAKTIFLGVTGLCYIAAGIQIVIYKKRPNSFGEKNGAGLAGSSDRTDKNFDNG